jgi:hypothetical protein
MTPDLPLHEGYAALMRRENAIPVGVESRWGRHTAMEREGPPITPLVSSHQRRLQPRCAADRSTIGPWTTR